MIKNERKHHKKTLYHGVESTDLGKMGKKKNENMGAMTPNSMRFLGHNVLILFVFAKSKPLLSLNMSFSKLPH